MERSRTIQARTAYGVVAVLVAALMIASSLAVFYYYEQQQESSQNQKYVGELNSALASYRSLSGSFNASLLEYGQTLNLLSSAVANLNTSTPAYRNASLALSSLWASYQRLASYSGRRALVYGVDLFVDFGNGTRRWYNDTSVQPGWNGYTATLVLMGGNLQAVWYPQYGEHLVTGLGGAAQTSTTSWFFWEFSAKAWALAPTGADGLLMDNGTTVAWTLCGYDSSYNPTCTP
jgi:type II secretory pathway pseudopilin PulG